ncbi:MAG: hypothetical protein HQL32_17500 [Planctomycetes bacterium]|nr:hypothetical protein [Planctomycetota bacterium]
MKYMEGEPAKKWWERMILGIRSRRQGDRGCLSLFSKLY